MTLEGCECWRECCDLGPHACICGNDCDRDETTGIPMAELRDAGVEQHLRPLQDELDRIADELSPLWPPCLSASSGSAGQ